jgi:hypothetical protein
MKAFETMSESNDPLLRPLLALTSESAREDAVAELLSTHVYWRIDRILSSRFAQSRIEHHHRDDIRNEILVRLVGRLHGLTTRSSPVAIASFTDYVSVVAFNTFDELVRHASPLRERLRNRIRYALRHNSRLALWEVAGTALCGLPEWKGMSDAGQLVQAPRLVRNRGPLDSLLLAIFEETGKPMALDDIVSLVADVRGITDREVVPSARSEATATDRDPAGRLADLQYLHKLWEEIRALPLRQRMALLLSARDTAGESVVRVLPVVGVASIRQIGSTLSIDADRLAELWPELPLEDMRIAAILKMTRQQVINLRRTARERLQRRMREHGRTGQR